MAKKVFLGDSFYIRLVQIVEANAGNEQFGVNELVQRIGLSRSQVHRKLKLISGQSTSQFIREIRLKQAHKLLELEEATVSEIAYRVGFHNPTYFSKCFSDYFGYPPGSVKKLQLPASKSKVGRNKGLLVLVSVIFSSLLIIALILLIQSWISVNAF